MKGASTNINRDVTPVYYWAIPGCIGLVLVFISQSNFLLFHVLAELFARLPGARTQSRSEFCT